MLLTIDNSQIKRFERELKGFAHKAYPFATKSTINKAAFTTQTIARATIRNKFITRNKWTEQSIRVNQSRTLHVRRQAAIVGSIEQYLEDQEFGASQNRSKGSKTATPIPQPFASGEGGRPMRRLVKSAHRRKHLTITKRGKQGKNRKQRNIIAIRTAQKQGGTKFVWLDTGRRKGIYRIKGKGENPEIRKVWDMSRKTVKIKKTPWLGPSVKTVIPLIPTFYRDALRFQLKRRGLFQKS